MALQHFTEESFDKALAQPGLLVVDFWAEWCGPCKMLGPVIEQLANDYDGKAVIGKVNVDDEPDLAQRYGIMSIPTVMFFKDGQNVDTKIGVMPPQEFVKTIEANL
ncbi:MAG: thioredoxin [Ruminococcaceae bacterium]|jgi:thioredoxin 1|nr:thioredoxin [Oscillospiraceae bacterium]